MVDKNMTDSMNETSQEKLSCDARVQDVPHQDADTLSEPKNTQCPANPTPTSVSDSHGVGIAEHISHDSHGAHDDHHEYHPHHALDVRCLNVNLAGRRVLTDVSLFVNSAEFVALIGPNGAGKTTLIRSILGLIPTSSGDVSGHGDKLDPRSIGYVPQRHEFAWDFPLTVREVVVSGLTGALGFMRRPRYEHQQAVEEALERAGIANLASRPVGELSGGQRQRVLVARALVLRPSVLLLDEPFTGLDMPTQEMLNDLFKTLAHEGHAVLMTTHDLVSALAECDRLYLINKTVIAHGTKEDLADAKPWIDTFKIRETNPLLAALGVK